MALLLLGLAPLWSQNPADLLQAARLDEAQVQTLFAALDLTRPGLETARDHYLKRDYPEALQALLIYFSNRPTPPGLASQLTQPADFRKRGQDALEDRFTLQGLTARQPRKPSGELDWLARGPRGDKEWVWLLNRHFFLIELLAAHEATGEDRYLSKVSELLIDWTANNPFPGRLSFSPPWRPLEAARRILNAWIPTFEYLRKDPERNGPALLAMLAALPDHAEKLDRFASFWGGNHLITEKMALASLAAAWPEFKQSPHWLDRAIDTLDRESQRQVYPDGSYTELTNHYQRVTLTSLQPLLPLLADREAPAAKALAERVESMWNYFIEVSRPDGWGPMNNASDAEFNFLIAAEASDDFSRPDWRYILSGGQAGSPPEGSPSRYFSYAGQAVFRTDWTPEAGWLFFDMGPHGAAHQHEDRLNVTFFAGGRSLLSDSGRYLYQPGPWKDYFSGPRAHNVVLLNGTMTTHPPRTVTTPLPVFVDLDLPIAAARASYPPRPMHGQGRSCHTRAVWQVSADYAVIVDELIAFGPNVAEAIWNFHPSITASEADTVVQLIAFDSPDAPQILDQRGLTDPVAGWFSPSYNTRLPALQRTYTFPFRRPLRLVWLLANPDAPAPDFTATFHPNRRVSLSITLPGQTASSLTLQFDDQSAHVESSPSRLTP